MTDKKNAGSTGVICNNTHIEADEGNILISTRVDSVVNLADPTLAETDEWKMMIVTSIFKKIMHHSFRPSMLPELADRFKVYVVMEFPEGILEDAVLAGLADRKDGITYRYSDEPTPKGLAEHVIQVKVKE